MLTINTADFGIMNYSQLMQHAEELSQNENYKLALTGRMIVALLPSIKTTLIAELKNAGVRQIPVDDVSAGMAGTLANLFSLMIDCSMPAEPRGAEFKMRYLIAIEAMLSMSIHDKLTNLAEPQAPNPIGATHKAPERQQ